MSTDLPITEASHGCSCGHHDEALPVLDARTIPHAVRHGAIIGAFQQVAPGAAMVLVAPHDPLPLLSQLTQLFGDSIQFEYLDRAPEEVKIKFTKVA